MEDSTEKNSASGRWFDSEMRERRLLSRDIKDTFKRCHDGRLGINSATPDPSKDLHEGDALPLASNYDVTTPLQSRKSILPAEREKYSRPRSTLDPQNHDHMHLKKMKKEQDKDIGHQSDGEKSDQDVVVDDASEGPGSPAANRTSSLRKNALDKMEPSSVGPMEAQISTSAVGPYPSHHPPAGPHDDMLGYPPGALNGYPARSPLQQLYDRHGGMRVPLGPLGVSSGKPRIADAFSIRGAKQDQFKEGRVREKTEARQSKRTVDITTTPKKKGFPAEGVAGDAAAPDDGKLEKIEAADAKPTTNGSAIQTNATLEDKDQVKYDATEKEKEKISVVLRALLFERMTVRFMTVVFFFADWHCIRAQCTLCKEDQRKISLQDHDVIRQSTKPNRCGTVHQLPAASGNSLHP